MQWKVTKFSHVYKMQRWCFYCLSGVLRWPLLWCSPFFSGFHRLKNGKDVLGEVLQQNRWKWWVNTQHNIALLVILFKPPVIRTFYPSLSFIFLNLVVMRTVGITTVRRWLTGESFISTVIKRAAVSFYQSCY